MASGGDFGRLRDLDAGKIAKVALARVQQVSEGMGSMVLTKRARRRLRKRIRKEPNRPSGGQVRTQAPEREILTAKERKTLRQQVETLLREGVVQLNPADLDLMDSRSLELRRCGWPLDREPWRQAFRRLLAWWIGIGREARVLILKLSRQISEGEADPIGLSTDDNASN